MTHIKKDNFILHNSNGKIVAISIAQVVDYISVQFQLAIYLRIRKSEVFYFLFPTLFPTCYNYFSWE